MTKPRDPEALLAAYLEGGMEVLPDRVVDYVLDEVHRTRQRAVFGPWRTRSMFRSAFKAAAVVAALALGSAFFVVQRGQPAVVGPSPSAAASSDASRPAVVSPSATHRATPTPTPILWTEASLKEDWPAPVRPEPVGGAIVLPVRGELGTFVLADPADDNGSSVLPWVDIRVVHTGSPFKVVIELADNHPPLVDPTEQWIAYGVVVDADRDGVPDVRYGIDNLPAFETDVGRPWRRHRGWRTDLHTGQTEAIASEPYDLVGDTGLDTFYPPGAYGPDGARLGFGGDVAGGGTSTSLDGPFYTWAAVIENGRVVATDYAPDVGWLDPWAKAKP